MLFGLLFFSCSSQRNTLNKDQCVQELKKALVGYWFYYPETNLYSEGKGTLHLTTTGKFYECLETLNKKQLIAVFGTPTEIYENKLVYMYKPGSFKDNTAYVGMYIELNKEGGFERISYFYIG